MHRPDVLEITLQERCLGARLDESVTKLLPSAKADSGCSTFAFPALTGWADGMPPLRG